MPVIVKARNGNLLRLLGVVFGCLAGLYIARWLELEVITTWLCCIAWCVFGGAIAHIALMVRDALQHRAQERDNANVRRNFEKKFGALLRNLNGEVLEVNWRCVVLTFPSVAERQAAQKDASLPDIFEQRRVAFRI